MKPWQLHLQRALARTDAPPVLTRDLLSRFARTARDGELVPPSSLTHWIRGAVAEERLRPVQRGLYLNAFRARPGHPADAAAWLRPEAVVSLNTVLGDAGVLNNPVRTTMAVVPMDAAAPPPKLGRQTTRIGMFQFHGIPRRILEAGNPEDRLELGDTWEHARATPEKALIDWLYLAASPHSRRTPPPRDDLDLDLLDRPRLQRLAQAAGVSDSLNHLLIPTAADSTVQAYSG
ncbi:hypothetical protein [Halofilum ochraceum]|uniref:hypothetical protein n=1 Tax=Halofilum ochraceum TaxID=1611323 RepID=UPI0008327B91|nr:hypothetical protein [Halofilum ochraceum]